MANVASARRWAYDLVMRGLKSQLAPITVLRGPRQVGKSTLQNQAIAQLLDDGVSPARILRVQFDDLRSLHKRESPIQIGRAHV